MATFRHITTGKRLLFIHIPRTGGKYVTSLFNESDSGKDYKLFLNENERLGGIVLEHLHYPLYNWYFNLEKIPHITIVREPWEKFKSALNCMYGMHNDYYDDNFKDQESFDDFMAWEREVRSYHNNWFMPQYKFISPTTHYWKYESGFGDDFIQWVYDKTGMKIESPRHDYFRFHNTEGTVKYNFDEEKVAKFVKEYYNKDYVTFDY